MEPQVRFCTSADGTRISYATVGVGRPLVSMLGWGTSFEAEWKDEEARGWVEQLADGRHLVRCERRGGGAWQGNVPDLSLDAHVSDLVAIADHLQLERFDLFGAYDAAGAVAVYAARYPQRIARVVLWAPFMRGSDINDSDAFDSFAQLCRSNWQLARRSWAGQVFPSGSQTRARWYSELLKTYFTPAVAAGYMEFTLDLDVTDALVEVQAPTLVLARDRDRLVPANASRSVASMLPNATFISVHGDEGYPPFGDISYLQELRRFLDQGRDAESATGLPSGTAIILFADIVDSTALTERVGDAAFRASSRALDTALRAIIAEAGGSTIDAKTLGDGVLATFSSASQAVDAALRCGAIGEAQGLPLHLGLHAGDVIREANNVFGGAVNIAARISALSAPGELLVSATVRELARTSAGVDFEDRGEHQLKGVADAQRVYAVRPNA